MDFLRLPSGRRRALSGLAGLALLAAGAGPLAAEPAQEIKRSIDEAGTAVNRQLGEWLGVAPERPARRRVSTRPRATAVPLPPPRPVDMDAMSPADAPTPEAERPDSAVTVQDDRVTAPAELPPPAQAPERAPERAEVPLPPPGPERQLAALPPPAASPPEAAPSPAPVPQTTVATICPELSNDALGVFTPVEVTATNTACTVDRGVALSAVRMKDGRLVTLEPAATLRCEMAAAVARWVREGVAPAVATLGAPLDAVLVAASQQCRPRNRVAGAKISEHGRGNALDISGYKLQDGRRFVIGAPVPGSGDQPMPVAFQEQIKASACADFTTILGPGSDGYHEQHLHVDRAERRSGAVLCQWAVTEAGARAPLPPRKPLTPDHADEPDEEGHAAGATEKPGTSQ
ncbi:extensin family protein [Ancylobacter sp. IITR112]|uniref:extensin-like domain-containing protein n=1 Tax=Ancylobacter sp. IITR112 TaxID=3138073 RepID=UPI00352A10DA